MNIRDLRTLLVMAVEIIDEREELLRENIEYREKEIERRIQNEKNTAQQNAIIASLLERFTNP